MPTLTRKSVSISPKRQRRVLLTETQKAAKDAGAQDLLACVSVDEGALFLRLLRLSLALGRVRVPRGAVSFQAQKGESRGCGRGQDLSIATVAGVDVERACRASQEADVHFARGKFSSRIFDICDSPSPTRPPATPGRKR